MSFMAHKATAALSRGQPRPCGHRQSQVSGEAVEPVPPTPMSSGAGQGVPYPHTRAPPCPEVVGVRGGKAPSAQTHGLPRGQWCPRRPRRCQDARRKRPSVPAGAVGVSRGRSSLGLGLWSRPRRRTSIRHSTAGKAHCHALPLARAELVNWPSVTRTGVGGHGAPSEEVDDPEDDGACRGTDLLLCQGQHATHQRRETDCPRAAGGGGDSGRGRAQP